MQSTFTEGVEGGPEGVEGEPKEDEEDLQATSADESTGQDNDVLLLLRDEGAACGISFVVRPGSTW